MGGAIEQVEAGQKEGMDPDTGAPRTFTWDRHIKVTGRKLYKCKLTGAAVKALVDTYKKESEFRDWCEKCL